MATKLPDPNTLDWGAMSKQEFNRMELAYELQDEDDTPITRKPLPLKTVSLQDALAVAYAAYRVNKETYIKETRRFTEEGNKTQFPNKDLVRYYWQKKMNTSEASPKPQNPFKLQVNFNFHKTKVISNYPQLSAMINKATTIPHQPHF